MKNNFLYTEMSFAERYSESFIRLYQYHKISLLIYTDTNEAVSTQRTLQVYSPRGKERESERERERERERVRRAHVETVPRAVELFNDRRNYETLVKSCAPSPSVLIFFRVRHSRSFYEETRSPLR